MNGNVQVNARIRQEFWVTDDNVDLNHVMNFISRTFIYVYALDICAMRASLCNEVFSGRKPSKFTRQRKSWDV